MRIPTREIFVAAAIVIATLVGSQAASLVQSPNPNSLQAIADRTLIRELMDRYGIVHDFGSAEEYAELFTADGAIAVGGGPVIVRGHQALIAQARKDKDRFDQETDANGKPASIMRHIISNSQISITGADTAVGTCYVTTIVKKGEVGPAILSVSRYADQYVRHAGEWRIQRREISLEFGNAGLAKQLGFAGT